MKTLAAHIDEQIQANRWGHCAVYEEDLQRLWPLELADRERKMEEFAKNYGFRLRDAT